MYCEVGDLEIYYEEYGEGTPVVMIHGYGIDHHVMTGCMEPVFLKRKGYRRIYLDLPGMGRTRAPGHPMNSDQILDAVAGFCEKTVPGEPFLVAGESYGGYLARGLVYKIPHRLSGVLLICPVIVAEKAKRTLPGRSVFARDEALLKSIEPEARGLFERMLVLQDSRRWERFQQDILPGVRLRDEDFVRDLMKNGYPFTFDVDRLERSFDRPSLLLAGRQDASVGYKDMLQIADNYPRGSVVVLDRAGHGLEVEQQPVFECLVNEWLDRVRGHESSH
ncbi:alpha/beta fold hydrolase [Methanocella arvoryzae]|uniref:Hydrolase (Alpha/beta fold family) n=1 Tax=Methanocella arvoryzae (strain DSM 22066 / NBRC 105507 / MRE50) TaxID=351160 RepID=Q0W562_METAR|nr:alpha/beta hydrolase [Methanocella arvoryzae]CAJ36481.1 hydrolase (alpha/beta fold family) [Methanocella arvoryzae MRE50]